MSERHFIHGGKRVRVLERVLTLNDVDDDDNRAHVSKRCSFSNSTRK